VDAETNTDIGPDVEDIEGVSTVGPLVWFDLVTPKSVRFFAPVIREIQRRGRRVWISARGGPGYEEVEALLKQERLPFTSLGEFGGMSLKGKLRCALRRQTGLTDAVLSKAIDRLVTLCSVDACRVAFGLGIPVLNFCDFPTRGSGLEYTAVARLTLPLSTRIFHPFVVPAQTFDRFLPPRGVVTYDFIDPVIYLQDQLSGTSTPGSETRGAGRPLSVVFREEEYKSSYVKGKLPFVYDTLKEALKEGMIRLSILPRYEVEPLRELFPGAVIEERKLDISEVLLAADLFVGGGGTITLEACWWGVPAVSTRSFLCHYDRWLLERGLMVHARSGAQLRETLANPPPRRKDSENSFRMQRVNLSALVDSILE